MRLALPKPSEFEYFADELERIELSIVWPKLTDFAPRPYNALQLLAYPGGLLDPPVDKSKLPDESAQQLQSLIASDPVACWVQELPTFKRFKESFDRLAKKKDKPFSGPCAEIYMWHALALGLYRWAVHIAAGTKPEAAGADDWRRALDAISALEALQDKDVSLWKAIKSHGDRPGATYKWLDELRDAIAAAAKSGPRPYKDMDHVSRVAVKSFSHWCWLRFDEVPPVLAVQFGALIGYTSERIARDYLPEWRKSFMSNSIV